tara:strand:+ start:805 stop:2202 length:1398 start_codon:yes stop_codon:yes gene_type:complete
MAYNAVKIPKFFIDHGLWLHATGVHIQSTTSKINFLQLNPSNIQNFTNAEYITVAIPRYSPITYTAFLGHDIKTQGGWLYRRAFDIDGNEITGLYVYNSDINLENSVPAYDGFSIIEFDDNPSWAMYEAVVGVSVDNPDFPDPTGNAKIGAISIGSTYTMPNAPNLSLSLSYEYGSTKEITSYTGASMSNTMWSKPPMWGDLGAWELSDSSAPNQALSRSGRRTWDLKFSYMDDGDLWGSNQSLNTYLETSTGLDLVDKGIGDSANMNLPNGDFTTGGSFAWGSQGVSFTSNNADFSCNGTTNCWILQFDILEPNTYYRLEYDVIDATTGQLYIDNEEKTPLGTTVGDNQFIDFSSVGAKDNGKRFAIVSSPNAPDSFAAAYYTIDNLRLYKISGYTFTYNLLTDDNFFSQVWHKTLGGTLPFVFQPDKDDTTQFAICRFKENSLKATQTAFNVYDISVKIEEVW